MIYEHGCLCKIQISSIVSPNKTNWNKKYLQTKADNFENVYFEIYRMFIRYVRISVIFV